MTSKITERRIENFKANKISYYCLIAFCIMFFLSLFAEFIANDKPLYINYKGKHYFPILKTYSEQEFGGFFESEANYKDNFLLDEFKKENAFILNPLIEHSFNSINFDTNLNHPSPPSSKNLLGTDDRGRDVLARLIYAFRISVIFGLLLTIFSSVIGITAGAAQGYLGGIVDLAFQRFIEIWSSIPTLFLLIIITGIIEPTFWLLLIFVMLFSWMALVGVVRAEVLKVRNYEYVLTAKALGVSKPKILFRHILPNSLISTFTFVPFIMAGSVTTLTSLDFLGVGLPIGYPSLGELLAQGKANMQAPWLALTAFFSLSTLLAMLVFIGEGLRDAFSPEKRV